ncbi:biotin/lipoate A/B protein ligase family protein [Thiohalospira sp.]|uniref:lipoate--protein ligase family protein n=1 Tax=Thiohalospira sp. TaxID=3080549 RepID=UPI003980536F
MRLRVLDFDYQSAYRSQAVYHGVAHAMGPDDDPVVTLVNPEDPYVCVGLHQDVELEVDQAWCQEQGLPIIRRHVGGGAVYLDRDQLFFHFIYPMARAPRFVADIYVHFIEPVLRTYRRFGIPATFRPVNDIHVEGRKIGGTGAATIGEATVMVGSFMFDFDVEAMARSLRVPSEKFRDKLRSGMADYITTFRRELGEPPSREAVRDTFLEEVAAALEVTPELDEPGPEEQASIAEQEQALQDPEWTWQQGRKFVEGGVKIAAGTHLTEGAHKAEGGLLRARLLEKDDHIVELGLSGDFTVFPEDGIDRLAVALHGQPVDEEGLTAAAAQAMGALGLDIPGVGPEDVVAAILAALHR